MIYLIIYSALVTFTAIYFYHEHSVQKYLAGFWKKHWELSLEEKEHYYKKLLEERNKK